MFKRVKTRVNSDKEKGGLMKDVDKEKDFLRFQTQRKITNLYKGFLIILEDMKASGYDIPEEYYQRIRKRVLDQGNDAIREMEEFYEKFEIRLK